MAVPTPNQYWIRPDALTITLNTPDVDYLRATVLAGSAIIAYMKGVIDYDPSHNYRKWTIQAADTFLETTGEYYVHAQLTRSESSATALIVYSLTKRSITGKTVEADGAETGEEDKDHFYIYLGKISASIDKDGQKVGRTWLEEYNPGKLDTNQGRTEEGSELWLSKTSDDTASGLIRFKKGISLPTGELQLDYKAVDTSGEWTFNAGIYAEKAGAYALGQQVEATGALASPFIDLKGADYIKFSLIAPSDTDSRVGLVFYDADEKAIEGVYTHSQEADGYVDREVLVPTGATMVRFTVWLDITGEYLQLGYIPDEVKTHILSSALTSLQLLEKKEDMEEMKKLFTENAVLTAKAIQEAFVSKLYDDTAKGVITFNKGVKLPAGEQTVEYTPFDLSALGIVTRGVGIFADSTDAAQFGGMVGTEADMVSTDYIDLQKADYIDISLLAAQDEASRMGLVFYNKDQEPVKGYYVSGQEADGYVPSKIAVPEGATQIRFSAWSMGDEALYLKLGYFTDTINTSLISSLIKADGVEKSEFTENALLTAAAFAKLFKLTKDEQGNYYIRTPYPLASDKTVSSLGVGKDGEGEASALSALYKLVDVLRDGENDKVSGAEDGNVLMFDAATGKWYGKKVDIPDVDFTEVNGKIADLQGQLNTLVSGNASSAIESFNEVVAFLKDVEDDSTLEGILAGKQNKITEENKLAYSLISGTPTKLSDFTDDIVKGKYQPLISATNKLDYSLIDNTPSLADFMGSSSIGGTASSENFAAVYWDGSAWKTRTIYKWALASAKPSYTTSEVTEGTRLYFTDDRAKSALKSTTDALSDRIAVFEKMFQWGDGDGSHIKTPYAFASDKTVSSLGVGSDGEGGLSYDRLDSWDNYDADAGAVLSATLGYELKQAIENIDLGDFDLTDYLTKEEASKTYATIVSLSGYQPLIADLATIRANAVLGKEAQSWGDHRKGGYALASSLATVATTGSYSDLKNVPTKLSDFTDDVVSGKYQPLIDANNRLAYSLLDGAPTALKNPNALKFGSKSYDGSEEKTVTAADLGALTEHQTIYALTIKDDAGKAQLTYTPNVKAGEITLTKSMVGLGLVENKSLSTWTGTTNITTLGTVTSGTWKATKIANDYIANPHVTIAGNKVNLGGSLSIETLQTSLDIVTLSTEQTITGKKTFTKQAVFYNGIQIGNDDDGVFLWWDGEALRVNKPFASDSTVSSLGVGEDGGEGLSFDILQSWDNYTDGAVMALGANLGYELKQAIENINVGDLTAYLTIEEARNTYATINSLSSVISRVGDIETNYLPLSGGIISGNLTVTGSLNMGGQEVIKSHSHALYIGYGSSVNNSLPTYLWGNGINFLGNNGKTKMLINSSGNVEISKNLTVAGSVYIGDNTAIHSGNYTNYAYTKEEVDNAIGKVDKRIDTFTEPLAHILAGKQDTITDLATIRANAALGATALQPSALNGYATEGFVTSQGYFLEKNFTKANIKTTLGISDWALASSKPSYKTSEVTEDGNLYFTTDRVKDYLTGAVSSVLTSNLTASRALISDVSGKIAVSAVTSTELGYLSGINGNIKNKLEDLDKRIAAYEAILKIEENNTLLHATVAFASDSTVSSLGVGSDEGSDIGGIIDLTNVVSHIIPSLSNAYTIGDENTLWKAVYATELYAGNIAVGSTITSLQNTLGTATSNIQGLTSSLSSVISRVGNIENTYVTSSDLDGYAQKATTLAGYGITDGMRFEDHGNNYVVATFMNARLSKIAVDYFIECWDGDGWWNWKAGKWITVGGTSSHFVKGDGSLDSAAYFPLSGGIIDGIVTIDNKQNNYGYIKFKNRRVGSGGYADDIIRITDGNDNVVGSLGMYGTATGVSFYYLGHGTYDGNNLRVYADKLTFGNNTVLHAGNYTDYALSKNGGTISGNLTVSGETSLSKSLTVQGKTELQAGLDVIGLAQGFDELSGNTVWSLSQAGNADFKGTLKVGGATTLSDKLTISKNGMSVTGAAYFGGGTTYYFGSTGNVSANTFTAAGAASLKNTLSVTGASTFTGKTTHNGGLESTTGKFSSTLEVSGNATFRNKIYLSDNVYIYWDSSYNAIRTNASFASDGAVSSLGVGSDEDGGVGGVIDLTNVVTNILPADSSLDIGSSSRPWYRVYASYLGAATGTTHIVGSNVRVDSKLVFANDYDYIDEDGNAYLHSVYVDSEPVALKSDIPSLSGYAKLSSQNIFTAHNSFNSSISVDGLLSANGGLDVYGTLRGFMSDTDSNTWSINGDTGAASFAYLKIGSYNVLHKGNTSYSPVLTNGTKIGTITIGGTATDLYAPVGGGDTSELEMQVSENSQLIAELTTDFNNLNENKQEKITATNKLAYSLISGTPTLGTAASKGFTTSVTNGSTDLVTSGAVYTSINSLGSSISGLNGEISAMKTLVNDHQGKLQSLTSTTGLASGYIKQLKADTLDLGGSTVATTDDLDGYLSLSGGGTVSGYTEFRAGLGLYGSTYPALRFTYANTNNIAWIVYGGGSTWLVTNDKWASEYEILHSGNIGSYALSKNGGTISGNLTVTGSLNMGGQEVIKSYSHALYIGYGSSVNNSLPTYLWGNGINFLGNDGKTKMLIDSSGNVSVVGTVTASTFTQSSDEKLKTVVGDVRLSLSSMAYAPLVQFAWNNGVDSRLHVGTLAQYWQGALPEVVSTTQNGTLALAYGELGVAMGISLANHLTELKADLSVTDDEVTKLKRRVEELENENKRLQERVDALAA